MILSMTGFGRVETRHRQRGGDVSDLVVLERHDGRQIRHQ